MLSLLLCEGTLGAQVVCTSIWAVIWFFAIKYSSQNIFAPWVSSQPWKDQWTELSAKCFKAGFFIEFKTTEEVFAFACLFLAILCQHLVGGLFCLPSLLGASGSVVSALACHGGLCEAGWELQDAVTRAHAVLFGDEKAKAMNPTPLLIILCLHHAMGLSMVIPMNILYRDNPYYHEFVFLLQAAAFFAMAFQNYGFTLDVKTASGLKQMKVCVTCTVAVMLWSRGFRYAFIGYKLISGFYADGNTKMLCAGGLVLCMMGVLNTLFIADSMGKFVKFMKTTHEDEDVHDNIVRIHSSLHRHTSTLIMSNGRKEWAKVRGAVHMGAFKTPKKDK